MSIREYANLLLTLLSHVLWTFGLIYASLNTIQSQAYVFNNIHGLFIVLILFLQGIHPSKKEWIGVVLAIIGCGFMIFDSKAARADGQEASIFVALIDIFSALFGAIYFLLQARSVKKIPIFLLIWVMNVHTFFINSCIAKI
jgi:drug/metabolite transporter (DMT)-like permease